MISENNGKKRMSNAKREHKKGRARKGMVLAVTGDWKVEMSQERKGRQGKY